MLCLPHARGGVSFLSKRRFLDTPSSPRTWGCFFLRKLLRDCGCVFPTHVGVFLSASPDHCRMMSLPHARGGVSNRKNSDAEEEKSSPRTWGCFQILSLIAHFPGVFPTHVGVFLRNALKRFQAFRSSPRTWGCFPCALRFISRRPVFPTHVGVFPTRDTSRLFLRGSSPRTWGCFFFHIRDVLAQYVFPTHVGVFLRHKATREQPSRLPHARGGVSYRCSACWEKLRSSPRTWGCF